MSPQELINRRARGEGYEWIYIDADAPSFKVASSRDEHLNFKAEQALHEIDWRCVYGLSVHVGGLCSKTVKKIVQAAHRGGAKRVVGIVYVTVRDVYFESIEIVDTEGVLTWPKS